MPRKRKTKAVKKQLTLRGVPRTHTTMRMSQPLMDDLKKIAEAENRSVTNLIETALREFVDYFFDRNPGAQEAIASVTTEAAETVSDSIFA